MMRLLQEIRGMAQITNRRPQTRAPGIFLMQLRAHVTTATMPRRRLVIPVDLKDLPDIPTPVKIRHLDPLPAASEVK